MKLTIIKNNFKKGLLVIERITGRNLTLPILNNVLLKASKNSLFLAGTNLELGINYWTLAKTEKEGEITIPAKILHNLINFLPEEKIHLETKGNTLFISGKNFKSQIQGLSADDFPIIPKNKKETEFIEVNNAPLLEGLTKVFNFCSLGQVHPELSGVYFNFQKDKLELVSTDSFRLAKKELYFQNKIKIPFSFIFPQKSARELVNILSEKNSKPASEPLKTKIYFEPTQIFFEFLSDDISSPQFRLTSRLIEGEYPNYQEILPQSCKIEALLNKEEFLSQIKSAAIFSGRTNKIKIKTDPGQGLIHFSAQSSETGEMNSSLPVEMKGKQSEAAFNYRFLMDGIMNLSGDKVLFGINGDEAPAVLKSPDDPDYVYVLMPIKS